MNVSDAVRAAARDLQCAGVPSPMVDSRLLMAHALGVEPTGLFMAADRPAPAEFFDMVSRRAERVPLQHITGVAWFNGLPLICEPGGFIPRPETELVVQWARDVIVASGARRVLDLCTGPGTIAVALACIPFPDAPSNGPLSITGIDIDTAALDLARRNYQHLGEQGRLVHSVEFIQADVSIPGVMEQRGLSQAFDLVVCNPPYVPLGTVDPEVLADPHHAVFSGADGMDLMPHVVQAISVCARPGAGIAIEHDDSTGPATRALLEGAFGDITQHRDLAGRDRFVTARKL